MARNLIIFTAADQMIDLWIPVDLAPGQRVVLSDEPVPAVIEVACIINPHPVVAWADQPMPPFLTRRYRGSPRWN